MADSQLLFHRGARGKPFLASLHSFVPDRVRRAAYLGASNGDRKEFFDLFAEAMKGIDVTDVRHVPAEASEEDRAAIDSAELILLAGGDVERGFSAFERSGVSKSITEAYLRGAIFGGGIGRRRSIGAGRVSLSPLLGAHEEPAWGALRKTVARGDAGTRETSAQASLMLRGTTKVPTRSRRRQRVSSAKWSLCAWVMATTSMRSGRSAKVVRGAPPRRGWAR